MANERYLDTDGLQAIWSKIDKEKVGKKERSVSDDTPLGEVFNTYNGGSWGVNTASGAASHAEGQHTTASAQAAHAEGIDTIASGIASHASGQQTKATGYAATAIGQITESEGNGALAVGLGTYTNTTGELAIGKYNRKDVYNKAFVIGGGSGEDIKDESGAITTANRKDLLSVDAVNGNTEIAGTLTVAGAGTFGGNLTINGTVNANDVTILDGGENKALSSIFVKQVSGKGLSTNDFTDEYKNLLDDYNTNGYGSLLASRLSIDSDYNDGRDQDKLITAGKVNSWVVNMTEDKATEMYVDDAVEGVTSTFLQSSDFIDNGGYYSGNAEDGITAGYLNEYITNDTYGKLGSANLLTGSPSSIPTANNNKIVTAGALREYVMWATENMVTENMLEDYATQDDVNLTISSINLNLVRSFNLLKQGYEGYVDTGGTYIPFIKELKKSDGQLYIYFNGSPNMDYTVRFMYNHNGNIVNAGAQAINVSTDSNGIACITSYSTSISQYGNWSADTAVGIKIFCTEGADIYQYAAFYPSELEGDYSEADDEDIWNEVKTKLASYTLSEAASGVPLQHFFKTTDEDASSDVFFNSYNSLTTTGLYVIKNGYSASFAPTGSDSNFSYLFVISFNEGNYIQFSLGMANGNSYLECRIGDASRWVTLQEY